MYAEIILDAFKNHRAPLPVGQFNADTTVEQTLQYIADDAGQVMRAFVKTCQQSETI